MTDERPPTIDPVAAARWRRRAPARSPWLHEEVGRRMEDRLQWIRLEPKAWADWDPVRGGLQAHALVERRYPKAECLVPPMESAAALAALDSVSRPWWRRWAASAIRPGPVPDGAVQMVWSNMALHMSAQPQTLIGQWHGALAVGGFVMFSCLGPDTVRELRPLYHAMGWPPPAHEFTDMHDWGDMLVQSGFAEPVMDMERITLTWETPGMALAELRELGANLHPRRFPALRGRQWRQSLEREMSRALSGADGRLALTFEIIYGHALRPAAKVRMSAESSVSLQEMRGFLRGGKSTESGA
jgi:malonyl-CoA O-methyltransferase